MRRNRKFNRIAARPSGFTLIEFLVSLAVDVMFWGSPGSDHPGGANYGLADGSVRFLPTSIDPNVFALLGSMADGAAVTPDD